MVVCVAQTCPESEAAFSLWLCCMFTRPSGRFRLDERTDIYLCCKGRRRRRITDNSIRQKLYQELQRFVPSGIINIKKTPGRFNQTSVAAADVGNKETEKAEKAEREASI